MHFCVEFGGPLFRFNLYSSCASGIWISRLMGCHNLHDFNQRTAKSLANWQDRFDRQVVSVSLETFKSDTTPNMASRTPSNSLLNFWQQAPAAVTDSVSQPVASRPLKASLPIRGLHTARSITTEMLPLFSDQRG
ncbi:hypothetical protein CEXT_698121 [Caerostris extrusa]|uniref:Uncharacterized protein n=1 Tax=Caerostris extrusa TaxID=172846 RepID=A0AAV4S0Z1_CAEEX|nr:hypothetical protein CEXT_698121 [Caerostris extrusa]